MMSWWQALLFSLIGGSGGWAIGRYMLADKVEAKMRLERELKARRELHDNGRSYPARSDAGPPARLHRATVKKARRKP